MTETVTLAQAKDVVKALAAEQSVMLLSSPGLGKSDVIRQAATEAGLPIRSLLGTQIAPEDVSGVPRIENERAVFCPPRVLLPEEPEPFCLFLDELPAAAPDVQKAFYAVLLERRIGEHNLPAGSWVVAAGNRAEDRALVRSISSALVNRVLILNIRPDVDGWLAWAKRSGIRPEIMAFIACVPEALSRPVPADPIPFSTPRAWASLSRSLDMLSSSGADMAELRRPLAFGKVTPGDASLFCAVAEDELAELRPLMDYVTMQVKLPEEPSKRWFLLRRLRELVETDRLTDVSPEIIDGFLQNISTEARFTLFVGLLEKWEQLGADKALMQTLREAADL